MTEKKSLDQSFMIDAVQVELYLADIYDNVIFK